MAVTINGTTGIVTPDIGVDGSTLVIDSANNRVGVLEDSPSNTLTVGDTVQPSYAPTRAGNYIEIARTSGADAGLLINKNTGQWLVGINNGDGANAPLRFEYAAAGSSHPGLGAGTLGMIIKHNGNVGIGTDNPTDVLDILTGSGDEVTSLKVKTAGRVELSRSHVSAPYIKTLMGSGNPNIILGDGAGDKVIINGDGASYFNGGNVGIGTANPGERLHLTTTSGNCKLRIDAASAASVDFYNSGTRFSDMFTDAGTGNFTITNRQNADIIVRTNGTNERLRISNSGRVGINVNPSSYANTDTALGLLIKNGHTSSEHTFLDIQNGTSESGRIRFVDGDNGIAGQIYFSHNTQRNGVGANCMGFFTGSNNLRFQVTTSGVNVYGTTDGVLNLDTTDGRGSFIRFKENGSTKVWAGCSEGIGTGGNQDDFGIQATRDIRFRAGTQTNMRLTAAGYLQVASDSDVSGDNEHIFRQHQTSYNVLQLRAETSSYSASGGGALAVGVIRSASSSYVFGGWYSGNNSSNFQDRKFSFRGDGNGYADGSWNGGGADYAEYFEWSDGNISSEDRRGISVVLDGDKIREATSGEDPIGVISANPSVVGDADDLQWKNKYLRTEYGSFDLDENGEQKLNPDYNSDQEYVSRENRPEWDIVGLMGKLRIRKGQITGSRWIKMRDVSANVEEWFVR